MTETKTLLRIGALSKAINARPSTLKFYSALRLIPFHQEDTRLVRRYDPQAVKQRLQEIQHLKDKGKSIDEIRTLLR